MFASFLIGTVLMTSLVMAVLLVMPEPGSDIRADRLPYVGAILAVLLMALAALGGMAVTA